MEFHAIKTLLHNLQIIDFFIEVLKGILKKMVEIVKAQNPFLTKRGNNNHKRESRAQSNIL